MKRRLVGFFIRAGKVIPRYEKAAAGSSVARKIMKNMPTKTITAFHGTNEPFSKFSFKKQANNELSGLGVWFSNKMRVARAFANEAPLTDYVQKFPSGREIITHRSGRGGHYRPFMKGLPNRPTYFRDNTKYQRIIKAEISLKNPLVITSQGKHDALEKLMDLRDKIGKPKRYSGEKSWRSRMVEDNRHEATQKLKDVLRKRGYDGIILKGTRYDAGGPNNKVDQIVAFGNKNIKQLQSILAKRRARRK